MEEQKIIEEMSKADKDLMGLCKLLFENWDGTIINAAKTVLEHYQPKIPEGSVVLSNEEWKQIKNSLYYSKEELEKKLQKARKETAEKILKWVKENFVGNINCFDIYFKEQFGVEIKEKL